MDRFGVEVDYWSAFYYAFSTYLLARDGDRNNLFFYFMRDSDYNKIYWADEYERIDLGKPISLAHPVENKPDLWEREYERGFVYVNVSDSISQSAIPGEDCKHINHQAMTVANWKTGLPTVTNLIVPMHRGAILLKNSMFHELPDNRPLPPSGLIVR